MRILLADAQTQRRAALRRLLAQEPELNVVGEATKANELLSQVEKARSVVVLLDWKLPGLQIGDVVTALRNARRNLKLVVLGDSEALRGDALAAGADAFLSTDEPVEWLLKTLYRVSGLSQSFAG